MSWILIFLKNLPAIMAAIQTLISIFAAKSAMANHVAFQASVAAGNLASAADWNWYVAGQGGGAAALAVSAAVCAIAQPISNQVFAAHRREQELLGVTVRQAMTEREQAATAYALKARMASLSTACQKIITGG